MVPSSARGARTVVGYILIVLAACCWGGSSSFGKRLLEAGVPTTTLMEMRTVFSGAALLLVLMVAAPRRLRVSVRDLPLLGVAGVLFALVNLSYYEAIKRLPIAVAVFVQFTAPVLVFAYGVTSGRERVRWPTMVALTLSVSGTYLMLGGMAPRAAALPWQGLLAAIVSAVAYAGSILLSHRLVRRLPTLTVVVYLWGFAALFWAAVESVPAAVHTLVAAHLLWATALFAGVSMLVPLPLFSLGIGRVSATGGAIASSSETIAASLVAFFVLGETLTAAQLAGGVLILTAVALLATSAEAAP